MEIAKVNIAESAAKFLAKAWACGLTARRALDLTAKLCTQTGD